MRTIGNRLMLAIAVAISLLQACDKVDPPYRENTGIIEIDTTTGTDTLVINGDTIIFPVDTLVPIKKVLAEDYTGLLCGNCPYAGLLLNDTIKPVYGDRLVVLSVHSGFFANPCPSGLACPGNQPIGALTTDFRTGVGNNWDAFFGNGNAGNPNGLIDRMDYPSNQQVKFPSVWATKIQERSNISAPFAIQIQYNYDADSLRLTTAVKTRAIGNQNGTYKLSVVLAEDSIIDWQEWYPPFTPAYDSTYIHRNVLRATYNSDFGQEIYSGTIEPNAVTVHAYEGFLSPNWNVAQCKIIAFVFDKNTYEVVQVEEVRITP